MLVVIQFPLFDPRGAEDVRMRLRKPRWPQPDRKEQFIRRFGGVFPRKKRGLRGFFAEEWLCRADKAIKLPKISAYRGAETPYSKSVPCSPKVAFRHFFLDGQATGKFEVGFYVQPGAQMYAAIGNLDAFVEHVLQQPARVADGSNRQLALIKAGPGLARLYQSASTWRKVGRAVRFVRWVRGKRPPNVKAGPPLVLGIVAVSMYDTVGVPSDSVNVTLGNVQLYTWQREISGEITQFVAIVEVARKNSDLARNLRLFLNRVHAELVCAEYALASIEERAAKASKSGLQAMDDELEMLNERRLSRITSLVDRIGKSARALRYGDRETPVRDMGEAVLGHIWGGRLDAVQDRFAIVQRRLHERMRPENTGGQLISQRRKSVFLSYRRSDTGDVAALTAARLKSAFPKGKVFHDVVSIAAGARWRDEIVDALQHCDQLITLIGPRWAAKDTLGHRRIDMPSDIVRLELEIALERGVPILPVLVNGAHFPDNLPPTLSLLPSINAHKLSGLPEQSDSLDQLITQLT